MLSKWLAFFLIMFILIPASLYAESSIKVFYTQQPAQALISTIAPLYGNQAKITARNNSLIVKAPKYIISEIEQLLNDLDKPLQNLLIEVRSSLDGNNHFQQDNVEGRIKIGSDGEIISRAPNNNTPGTTVRYAKNGSIIKSTHTRHSSSGSSPDTYRLRAIEGNWAYIQVGQKVPYYSSEYSTQYNKNKPYFRPGLYPAQGSIELENVTSGFDVYPTLNGDQVTLKVRPHNNSMNRKHPGRINTRSVDTVVSGKIGQWLYLGGIATQSNKKLNSFTHSSKRHSELDTGYQIKVNIID